ncbi:MAG TPA: polyphosphate kinase 1 [Cyclobacteriaceae bacterium]|jgi:polyphosphate kinase|nr:polyphosphate kinase 1 [Cytophagales bacterium]HRE66942.1 polyphosphate kinase 1 [Cyclobacteriaceae bacterium]HRF33116.1 polyphosphate kinase 1 [Cyclobacteriaceae bacterium]
MKTDANTLQADERVHQQIRESNYISRDLSWLQFNDRVLDQARKEDRSVFDRLRFLAITASNLDEFCTIRLGSLYNYLDYSKQRFDYSGLREEPFRKMLLSDIRQFVYNQNTYYVSNLKPLFEENGFKIADYNHLSPADADLANQYFDRTIYPMLTPMLFDGYHSFPALRNNRLLFGVVTRAESDGAQQNLKASFIQVPNNIPRFFEIKRSDGFILFVPLEEIIEKNIHQLFRNIEIISISLFRINRNGDFTLDESEDIESNFLEELRRKLQTRRRGRVVRIDTLEGFDPWLLRLLKIQWDLDEANVMVIPVNSLMDFAGLNYIIGHKEFKDKRAPLHPPRRPVSFPEFGSRDIFEVLKERDVLLHHPYDSMDPVLELLEKAAEDEKVLSIKITIYRVAKDSRVTAALLRAAENGKHVSVLFEVKARFDEENNLREAHRLRQAGCFVIYGVSSLKTHTKLLLIVRQEEDKVYRYVHLASGNYNEITSRVYTDVGLLTTNETYGSDVSDFFNVITGHSQPSAYRNLITSPRDMRIQLCNLMLREADNARNGLPSGIIIKINSIQDKEFIDTLYEASEAGVPIKLIVRGICCLRPGRKGLSENIEVISIVGEYLEHSRIYYFHNNNDPKVYIGSADAMVRSFDRRIESLFLLEQDMLRKQAMNMLRYNLRDNVNSYIMREDGSYVVKTQNGEAPFNIHKEFFEVTREIISDVTLF